MRNDFAGAATNCGVALEAQGQTVEAIVAYDQAIELGEGLRAKLEPRGAWTPEMRNDLARAYGARAAAHVRDHQTVASVVSYGNCIVLQEMLRTELESRGVWFPALRDSLAMAYAGRALALEDKGELVVRSESCDTVSERHGALD